MKHYDERGGIFANITSLFGSSIIVVRLSGSRPGIEKVCKSLSIPIKKLEHAKALLCKLYIEENLLDESIVTIFNSPKSFTGEECLEISLHGSKFIFDELAKALLKADFRFALPGEFSYRAFLNNKMDLIKAEGLANLIASESSVQHKSALQSFTGRNSDVFNNLKEDILHALSSMESLIDFSDEDLPDSIAENISNKINSIKEKLLKYTSNSSIISLNSGLRIAIFGPPNAGKSSLFNCLCGHPKAIVSSIAGTTRDILEEKIILKGIPLIFYDTAGLRKNPSEDIEAEGIKRTRTTLSKSDIKLLVLDTTAHNSFEELAKLLDFTIDSNTILVSNKTDIKKNPEGIAISALTGEGVDKLIAQIELLLEKNFLPLIEAGLISNERQRNLLNGALLSLQNFNMTKEIELAAEDLRRAAFKLEEIIGKVGTEDILGNIFSRFCIGK